MTGTDAEIEELRRMVEPVRVAAAQLIEVIVESPMATAIIDELIARHSEAAMLVVAQARVDALRTKWECSCPFGGRNVRNFRTCIRCKTQCIRCKTLAAAEALVAALREKGEQR